ncbi:MAG: stage III sporulation protein AE [Lachnospiraceae bacterium]|nr:stage III sporulation protein AE [Lachnospiraceae bacterium]
MKWAVMMKTEEILQEILDALDFDSLNTFVSEHLRIKMTFKDLVALISSDGLSAINAENICTLMFDSIFYELSIARPIFLKMLCFAILFSIIQKLIVTKNRYISDMGFLMIYGTMMILLMQSFFLVRDMTMEGMNSLLKFLNALIPTYAVTLVFSGNAVSGAMFYEVAFMMIYFLELLMKNILSPLIHIFVLVRFLNYLFEEDKLSKLAELMEKSVSFILKMSFGTVIGLSVIQSMLTPAKDRLAGNAVLQGISSIPGIGNTIGSASELLLSCGLLIKNSIGVVSLIILVAIAMIPILKIGIFWLFYHLLSAILQPIADKRITECVAGVARGCNLYLKIMIDSMLLFFILLSIISVATSFIF